MWITCAHFKPRVNDNKNPNDLSQWLDMRAMDDQMFAPLCFFILEAPTEASILASSLDFCFHQNTRGWGRGRFPSIPSEVAGDSSGEIS